jgi:two-component system, LytTR family, sensor kinase
MTKLERYAPFVFAFILPFFFELTNDLLFKQEGQYNKMKKSTNYAPYLFALIIPALPGLTNNLFSKPGVVLNWAFFSLVLFIWWRLNEWLLNISDNGFVKWGSLLLGSSLYVVFITGLDYYVLHLMLRFTGFSPPIFGLRMFTITFISSFIIEAIKWAKAREQSKIENLMLQAENIEAQFNLLIQQVNPDFLLHSLTTLQTMVRTDDPQGDTYVLKLADVYRQTLKKERSAVSLAEELTFFESFLFLMIYGQEEAITFEVNVSDASLSYHLPVFSLQLLGENCIKHNVFSIAQPLHIQLFQKDPKSITIVNNYQPKALQTASFGVGIENLKMRYALEGIQDAVCIEQTETTYSTTIKLF